MDELYGLLDRVASGVGIRSGKDWASLGGYDWADTFVGLQGLRSHALSLPSSLVLV